MTPLPALDAISSGTSRADSSLAVALSILFEPSPTLLSTLEPQIAQLLPKIPAITSYVQLIDLSLSQISAWDKALKGQFIAGHPRIGESKNLSSLSAKEQGAASTVAATPPEVLARLAELNEQYERRYPGLRYITFVNGRTRAEIAQEMESRLGSEDRSPYTGQPAESVTPVEVEGEEWSAELERAIQDIGLIAKSRLSALGVK